MKLFQTFILSSLLFIAGCDHHHPSEASRNQNENQEVNVDQDADQEVNVDQDADQEDTLEVDPPIKNKDPILPVETEEELVARTRESFILQEVMKRTEDNGVPMFTLEQPYKLNIFKHLKALNFLDSEFFKLNFNQRDIYLQASDENNALDYPAMQCDRAHSSFTKKNGILKIEFDGESIVEDIEFLKKIEDPLDTKRFMFRILLTDDTQTSNPIVAIILIPIEL